MGYNMKKAIILIILWIIFVACYIAWGDSFTFTDKQICDCIYFIEGKEKARQPYGIETIECKSKEYCEQICLNTIRNNRIRYKEYGYKKYKDYLSFLASRYCPYNQKNWLRMLNSCLKQKVSCDGILITKENKPTKIYPDYTKTPQDIEDWLIREGFKYKNDEIKEDEWKPPEQTIKDMKGDCEDVAILACYILEDLGYTDVMLIAIYGEDLAHGICWFKEKNDTWSFISTSLDLAGKPKYYWDSRLDNAFSILYVYFPEWETIKLCTPQGYAVKTFYRQDIEKGVTK